MVRSNEKAMLMSNQMEYTALQKILSRAGQRDEIYVIFLGEHVNATTRTSVHPPCFPRCARDPSGHV